MSVSQKSGEIGSQAAHMNPVSVSESDESRRSAERSAVTYFGILSFGDQQVFKVDLVDLSAQGARMIAPPDCNPPDDVVLKIPETGANFRSEIAWRNGTVFGIRFLSPEPD